MENWYDGAFLPLRKTMWDWDGDFTNHAPAKTIQAWNISDVIKCDTCIVKIVYMHMCGVVLSEEPIWEGASSFHLSACKDSSCCDMIQQFSFVLLEGGVRDVIIDLRRLCHRLPLCSTGCRMSPGDFTQLDPSHQPPPNPPNHHSLPLLPSNRSIMRLRTPLCHF